MQSNDDLKIGLSILKDIEKGMNEIYGDTVAIKKQTESDTIFTDDNKRFQQRLDAAEEKIGDFQEGLAYASFLRGRLFALYQGGFPMQQWKCKDHYQKAIDLGYDEAEVRYYWGFHNYAWYSKKEAIPEFEKVVEIRGVDDPLGMEAAKQIETLKAEKNGGCFIATAVYESYDAPEVVVLRKFRDNILLTTTIGKMFVKIYYLFSPPIAKFLTKKSKLKFIVREKILTPFVRYIENILNK